MYMSKVKTAALYKQWYRNVNKKHLTGPPDLDFPCDNRFCYSAFDLFAHGFNQDFIIKSVYWFMEFIQLWYCFIVFHRNIQLTRFYQCNQIP